MSEQPESVNEIYDRICDLDSTPSVYSLIWF